MVGRITRTREPPHAARRRSKVALVNQGETSERAGDFMLAAIFFAIGLAVLVLALLAADPHASGPYGAATPYVQSGFALVLGALWAAKGNWGDERLPRWIRMLRYAMTAMVVASLLIWLVVASASALAKLF